MGFNPHKKQMTFAETATLNLVDPITGIDLEEDGKPVSITVYGKSSKQHRKAVEALLKKEEKLEASKKKGSALLDERRANSIEFLMAISVSTDNLVDADNNPVESAEQFKELYSDEEVSWIRDQVSAFASVDTNFMKV